MRRVPWVRMPSSWILQDGLRTFLWKEDSLGKPALKIAALRCYIVIAMHLELRYKESENDPFGGLVEEHVAIISYTKLSEMAGISRASLSGGLHVLEQNGVITRELEGRNNVYRVTGFYGNNGWCKLPCRALLSSDLRTLKPFQDRPLRSKKELYALKMYLYLCAVRDNRTLPVVASYEKINAATSIPEREIPGAWAYLIGIGLLSHVSKKEPDVAGKIRHANEYYLMGYRDLVMTQSGPKK